MTKLLAVLLVLAGCGGGDDLATEQGAATDPTVIGAWTLTSDGGPVSWSESWAFGAGGDWSRNWSEHGVYPAGAERGTWSASSGTLTIQGPGGINVGVSGYALVDCGRPAQCLRLTSATGTSVFAR